MELDQLKDFNEVMEYYREILTFFSKIDVKSNNVYQVINNHFLKNNRIFSFSDLTSKRIILNNLSMFITQHHDRINIEDEEQLLETAFSDMDFLNSITCKESELSLFEKKKQVRNCLAHSDYHIVFEILNQSDIPANELGANRIVSGKIYVHIENEKIDGKISYDELFELAERYINEYRKITYGNNINLSIITKDSVNCIDDFINVLHTIKIIRKNDNTGMPFDEFAEAVISRFNIEGDRREGIRNVLKEITEGFNSFDFEKIEKPGFKQFLKEYIEYIGFDNLYSRDIAIALSKVLTEYNEQLFTIGTLTLVPSFIDYLRLFQVLDSLNNHKEGYKELKNETLDLLSKTAKIISYQAPMLYADNLIGMTYYMLNYTREINEQNERRYFNYYNIGNLEGISAKLVDDNGNEEEVPIQIDPVPKLQKELKNVKTDLSNLRRRMQFKRRKLRKMENPEDRTPNKEETIISLKEELSNDEKNAEEYVSRRDRLERDIEECQEKHYRDSSDFFRHIRNSLAHGNNPIIYRDLNNIEETTYCFKDIDERTLKTYTVELTARQLLMILDAVQLKVNECDRGYLDGKAIERKIMEVALRQCEVGMDEVNDEQLIAEKPIEERGDEEIDES